MGKTIKYPVYKDIKGEINSNFNALSLEFAYKISQSKNSRESELTLKFALINSAIYPGHLRGYRNIYTDTQNKLGTH